MKNNPMSKIWNQKQIKDHEEAAQKLGLVKDDVKEFLSAHKNVSESEVLIFIKKRYRAHGLINDDKKEFAIVAFRENTSAVHYFPKKKGLLLKNNSLILLDIWARLDKKNTPYADMTWMFYFLPKQKISKNSVGRIPKDIEKKWQILRDARDTAVETIKKFLTKNSLPRGLDIDRASHDFLGEKSFGENIKHTVGHSLGFDHPHGTLPGINWREYRTLSKNIGYTIEPGMYFEKKFGLRTEIDFYISKENKVIVTTPVQENIDLI